MLRLNENNVDREEKFDERRIIHLDVFSSAVHYVGLVVRLELLLLLRTTKGKLSNFSDWSI